VCDRKIKAGAIDYRNVVAEPVTPNTLMIEDPDAWLCESSTLSVFSQCREALADAPAPPPRSAAHRACICRWVWFLRASTQCYFPVSQWYPVRSVLAGISTVFERP